MPAGADRLGRPFRAAAVGACTLRRLQVAACRAAPKRVCGGWGKLPPSSSAAAPPTSSTPSSSTHPRPGGTASRCARLSACRRGQSTRSWCRPAPPRPACTRGQQGGRAPGAASMGDESPGGGVRRAAAGRGSRARQHMQGRVLHRRRSPTPPWLQHHHPHLYSRLGGCSVQPSGSVVTAVIFTGFWAAGFFLPLPPAAPSLAFAALAAKGTGSTRC